MYFEDNNYKISYNDKILPQYINTILNSFIDLNSYEVLQI